jgi:hypothetical protein
VHQNAVRHGCRGRIPSAKSVFARTLVRWNQQTESKARVGDPNCNRSKSVKWSSAVLGGSFSRYSRSKSTESRNSITSLGFVSYKSQMLLSAES